MIFRRLISSRQLFVLSLVSIWVFLTFLPALTGEFLNWDDSAHVTKYSAVQNFDVVRMFSECVQKIYIPLTSLTFALEHKLFGNSPFVYHFNNLLLHCANSLLVYGMARCLGIGLAAAFFSALLFGVHPMRVESVAWITERKDLLYAFFYLLAMRWYWQYLKTDNKRFMILCFVSGLLSLLAKPMALSLPVILVVLDWFSRRRFVPGVFLEKIPLALVFVPIVWMTYQWHVRNPIQNLIEALITWIWTFNFYLWKFICPANLSAIYQFPLPGSFNNPIHIFSVVSFLLIFVWLYQFRKDRWVIFSMLFYFGSIFFLLRFDHANDINIVADRFMYLPCLGLCWLIGKKIDVGLELVSSKTTIRTVLFMFLCVVLGLLSMRSIKETAVWNNSITLWSRVIENYPQQLIAYNDRAVAFLTRERNDLALYDYNAIVRIDPNNADAYFNRGLLFQKMEKHLDAISDLGEVIKRYPYYERAYDVRGKSFEAIGRDDWAVEEYSKAVRVTPAYADAFLHRGNVYNRRGILDRALSDYLKVIEINPRYARAFNNCASVYAKLNDDLKAMEYVNRAIELDPLLADAFYNRSILFQRKDEQKKAKVDMDRFQELGGK